MAIAFPQCDIHLNSNEPLNLGKGHPEEDDVSLWPQPAPRPEGHKS